MIPVSVITGFLGSGKTTLLARLLRDPAMARTAVIINEFGAVGLDHELVETSDESFIQLSNGCLCCNVRSDLVLTLGDLAARRAAGTVPPFERVVIETTGLADPAPILHALMTDRGLCDVYALDGVITTVDAVTGMKTLDTPGRSGAPGGGRRSPDTHQDRRAGSANCRVARAARGYQSGRDDAGSRRRRGGARRIVRLRFLRRSRQASGCAGWLAHEAHGHVQHHHKDDITSFCIVRDQPLHAVTLPLLLSALAENCGADLLRMKGLVNVVEEPQRPAVIHGVQHVYHAPVWLARWPSDDRRTRMVFIGRNIRESWARSLIELIDAEVANEIARRGEVATI